MQKKNTNNVHFGWQQYSDTSLSEVNTKVMNFFKANWNNIEVISVSYPDDKSEWIAVIHFRIKDTKIPLINKFDEEDEVQS